MMVIAELNNDSDTTWKQTSWFDQNHCIVSSFFPVDRKMSWFILEKYTHKQKERKESQNPNIFFFSQLILNSAENEEIKMYQSLYLLNLLTAASSSHCLKMNQLNYSCHCIHAAGLELPLYHWLQLLSLYAAIVKKIENCFLLLLLL